MQKQRVSAVSAGLGLILSGLAIAAPAGAQGSAQRPAAKGAARPATPAAAPAAAMPQITVAGLRVAGPGIGANGTEVKPFMESPGTTVVLAIQAPKGNGIVDIDDHASKLDVISDDKGASLLEEARVGPFPKITEDGSAALVELEVRARPSAGTASVSAQGTIAMTLAGGSKPIRAANVKMDANQTFKIGATTLTIAEAKVEDEATRLTVNLPRSLLTTIREIRFFDAKNAPLEGHRRGSGYFNEKAELELEVKTKDKAFAIEFEVWQNLRTVKAPFKLEAGLGFAAGPRAASTDGASSSDQGAKAPPAAKKADGPPPAITAADGAASVDAVLKQMQTSAAAGKGAALLAVVYPTERTTYAQMLTMAMAMMPLGLMSDEKASTALQKDLDAFFDSHKLKPPFMRDDADDLFKGVDVNQFVNDAFAFMKAHAKKGENPTADFVPQGKLSDVKIDGDTATAQVGDKPITFSKINTKWFIRLK